MKDDAKSSLMIISFGEGVVPIVDCSLPGGVVGARLEDESL